VLPAKFPSKINGEIKKATSSVVFLPKAGLEPERGVNHGGFGF